MYQYCLRLDLLYDLGGYFDRKAGKRQVVLAKYPPKRVNPPKGRYVGHTAILYLPFSSFLGHFNFHYWISKIFLMKPFRKNFQLKICNFFKEKFSGNKTMSVTQCV